MLGFVLILASLVGVGSSIYLLFGEPLANVSYGTYKPNWEDIGPLMISSVISLLVNISLVGGAKILSKGIVLVLLFWTYYGYCLLKHHGYIDWSEQGMRPCWWCQSRELQERIGYGAAIASLVLLSTVVPVQIFHSKLKKEHRRLTEFEYELTPPEYSQYR